MNILFDLFAKCLLANEISTANLTIHENASGLVFDETMEYNF